MTAIDHHLPAPKTLDEMLYPSKGPADDWNAEMDVPIPTDPAVLAELEVLAYKRDRAAQQNVEWMLQKYEENYRNSEAQRWKGQDRWMGRENEDMRLTRIMHPHTFIYKLRRAGVDARIRQEREGRLWLNDFSRKGRIGITAWLKDEARGLKVEQTVTTLQYPCGPEYSIMRFKEYDIPTSEKYRGWRTALLALVLAFVITEEEADRAFGPAEGAAAHFYRLQMKGIRRKRMGLEI